MAKSSAASKTVPTPLHAIGTKKKKSPHGLETYSEKAAAAVSGLSFRSGV